MHEEIALAIEPGLGDHFICNGLVNHISKFYSQIYLPVYDISVHSNWHTIEQLYASNSKVRLVRLSKFMRHWETQKSWSHFFSGWNVPTLQIKLAADHPHYWYKWFYHQLLIDWDCHFTQCNLPPASANAHQLFETVAGMHDQYVLVHDHSTYGRTPLVNMPPTDLPVVKISSGVSNSLLDWRLVIERASQIHVVQSSVFWLCSLLRDSLQAQVFYHKARPGGAPINPNDFPTWTFIPYDN